MALPAVETLDLYLVRIEPARILAWQALCKRTFIEAYTDTNTPANMAHYLATGFTEEKLARALADAHSECYFVLLANEPIGYLKLNTGDSQTEIQAADALEIERIYVVQAFYGRQVGQFLLDSAVAIARRKQKAYLWLGVWEKNPRARRFYEKNGFAAFGSHIFQMGDDPQTDILMKLTLAS